MSDKVKKDPLDLVTEAVVIDVNNLLKSTEGFRKNLMKHGGLSEKDATKIALQKVSVANQGIAKSFVEVTEYYNQILKKQ